MEINPNDPLIPYLIAARQEKIKAQETAEANATNSAIEQQRDLAWQLFQETGRADEYIASVLGIPVGTTTMDYKKNQYDINKPYYKPGESAGGSEIEPLDLDTHIVALTNYGYLDPNGRVFDLDNGIKDANGYTPNQLEIINYISGQLSNGRMLDNTALTILYKAGFTQQQINEIFS